MSNLIVYKSNYLIEASYKLSQIEQHIILYCISKINPLDKDTEEQKIQTIYADDFIKQYPNMAKNHVYKQLKDGINDLYNRSLVVKKPERIEMFRWIQAKYYYDQDGKAIIKFSDDIMPYLTDFKEQFTKYKLRNISAFKRIYSIRLYEILTQYKALKSRILSVSDLRILLELYEKYFEFKELKRNVIDPSIEEINEKSDLLVDYKLIKKGRSIDSIEFIIKDKRKIKNVNSRIKQENNETRGLKTTKELAPEIQEQLDKMKAKLKSR